MNNLSIWKPKPKDRRGYRARAFAPEVEHQNHQRMQLCEEAALLVCAQRPHRIDRRCPMRWEERRQQSGEEQNHSHHEQHREVHRAHSIQCSLHGAAHQNRASKPYTQPGQCEQRRLPEDEQRYPALSRPPTQGADQSPGSAAKRHRPSAHKCQLQQAAAPPPQS